MSELRQRPVRGNSDEAPGPGSTTAAPPPVGAPKKSSGCPIQVKSGTYYYVRKAVVILFPAYILCCMFGVLEPPRPMAEHTWDAAMLALGRGPRIFSAAELKAKGSGSRPMLSILGEVFDVSKGAKHYGKGGAYESFTGKDASRSFVSGNFTEAGLTDDLSGLEPSKCLGIKDWHEFYQNHELYKKRGLLAGRFYNANGKPTRELAAFHKCARKGAKEKEREAAEKLLYPSCNSRWSAAEGGRVWCEDEKKVPRKFAPENVHGAGIREQGEGSSQPKSGNTKQAAQAAGGGSGLAGEAEASTDAAKVKGRCSCFDVDYVNANEHRLLSYGGCAPDSNSCMTKPPEAPGLKPKPKRRPKHA
ncbi:unnamed protein product [Ectocarpus sp. 12 AP-2014]